jgi:hypothetical protein
MIIKKNNQTVNSTGVSGTIIVMADTVTIENATNVVLLSDTINGCNIVADTVIIKSKCLGKSNKIVAKNIYIMADTMVFDNVLDADIISIDKPLLLLSANNVFSADLIKNWHSNAYGLDDECYLSFGINAKTLT